MIDRETKTKWVDDFDREMERLYSAVALVDDFWANVEPEIAVKFAWRYFADVVMTFPALRRDIALYSKDASPWDGIKRRWTPKWFQRRWPPLVEVYDIDEITSPNGEQTRYLLRMVTMTQEQWETKLREIIEENRRHEAKNSGCKSMGTTNDADDWKAVRLAEWVSGTGRDKAA